MSTIIPFDIEGVRDLLTARRWERAAIVWAWTEPQQGRRTSSSSTGSRRYSIEEFAALGITGLRSSKTVGTYRQRWQDAIDFGYAMAVRPGDAVDLPKLPWPASKKNAAVRIAKLVADLEARTSELQDQLDQAFAGRAWRALGYPDWESYLDAELPVVKDLQNRLEAGQVSGAECGERR